MLKAVIKRLLVENLTLISSSTLVVREIIKYNIENANATTDKNIIETLSKGGLS